MLFTWLRRRRRRKLLSRPYPAQWDPHFAALPFYLQLDAKRRDAIRDITRVLVTEKNWEGCGGLSITEEMQVTIAAGAALLLLGLEHEYYRHVDSILVYPTTIMARHRQAGPGGLVREGKQAVIGLAHYRGPIVLAWDSARHGGENWEDGRNVILHEFAHKLDMLDHFADGTPPIHEREQYDAWVQIMTREYELLVKKTEKGRRTLMDKYGATNPAEFFAVATECFFEKGRAMKRKHPELYELLKTYYRQDPAGWRASS